MYLHFSTSLVKKELPFQLFAKNKRILLSFFSIMLLCNLSHTQVPGGITTSTLKLWFKGNQGVTATGGNVSQWNDISGQGNVTTQPSKTANTHITYRNSGANYNPTLLFDGTRLEQLKGSANNLGGTPTLFTVSKCSNTALFNPIFSNFEINPTIPDPNLAKEVGPGLFIYFNSYVVDAYEAWLPVSADAPAVNNRLDIMTSIYGSSTSTADAELYQNGILADIHTGPTKPLTPGRKVIEIGGRSGDDAEFPGRIFNGDIAEIIYFTDRLVATDRQKVESYLAIKYGITLTQNYLSSNATVIYDVATHNKRIIGIGRDDASVLNQKQSKGENYTPILEIGLSQIATDNNSNTSAFTADRAFFITGDDDQSLTGTSTGTPPGIESWLIRKWKSTVTGSAIANIALQMPSSVLNTLPGTGDISVLFSSNSSFTAGLTTHKMNLSGSSYTAVIPQAPAGTRYFTFVRCLKPLGGNDISICDATSVHDFPDALPYEAWSLINNPPGSSPLIQPATGSVSGLTVDGVYSFALKNNNCECYDTVIIRKGTLPVVTGVGSNSPVCEGEQIIFTATSSSNNYSWTGPNGFTSFSANPVIDNALQLNSGTYNLMTDNLGCGVATAINVIVNIKPTAVVTPDTTICTVTPLQLVATGGNSYQWSPPSGLSSATISNPIASPVSTTTYQVIVSNNGNCSDTAYTTIYLDQALCDGEVYFPTAFTPNGDGLNDSFKPGNGFSIITEFELKVYNRWGQLVFKSNNPALGWDGRFKGEKQPGNVFVWQATYKLVNGKKYFKKGTILLIR